MTDHSYRQSRAVTPHFVLSSTGRHLAVLISVLVFAIFLLPPAATAVDLLAKDRCQQHGDFPHWFSVSQTQPHWAVVAVNPGWWDDIVVSVYDNPSGQGDPLVVSDRWSHNGGAEHILVNFREEPTGTFYIKVDEGDSGADDEYVIEWDYETHELRLGEIAQGTVGGGGGSCLVDVWDIYLEGDNWYTFTLERLNGTADVSVALVKSVEGEGGNWVHRDQLDSTLLDTRWSDTPHSIPVEKTGYYAVLVVNDTPESPNATYRLTVDYEDACEPMEDAVCQTDVADVSAEHWYQFSQGNWSEHRHWAAVAVSMAELSAFDLEVYSGSCRTGTLEGTSDGFYNEFVVGDFNHITHGSYYPRVFGESGPETFVAQWDGTAELYGPPGEPVTGTLGRPEDAPEGSCESIIDVYEISLIAEKTYKLLLQSPGDADIRAAFFRSDHGYYWKGRGDSEFEVGINEPSDDIVPETTDEYAVVVFLDEEPGNTPETAYILRIIEIVECVSLSDGICTAGEGRDGWYEFTKDSSCWGGILVNPSESGDIDMKLYRDCNGGTDPLAKATESGVTEFIVGDLSQEDGSFHAQVIANDLDLYGQWNVECHTVSNDLTLDVWESGTLGCSDDPESDLRMMKIWNLDLDCGGYYEFSLRSVSGHAGNIRMALFDGMESPWKSREECIFEMEADDPPETLEIDSPDQTYGLVVFNDGDDAPTLSYELKVEQVVVCEPLTNDTCKPDRCIPRWYSFDQTDARWTAVAIKSFGGDEKRLELHDTCDAENPLQGGVTEGYATKFVVGDCINYPSGDFFPKILGGTEDADFIVQWDAGTELPLATVVEGDLGADPEGICNIIDVYDLQLEHDLKYTITCRRTGEAEIWVAVAGTADGRQWRSRDQVGGSGGFFMAPTSLTRDFETPSAGVMSYAIVIYSESTGGETGHYEISVSPECEELTANVCLTDQPNEPWTHWYRLQQQGHWWMGVALQPTTGSGKLQMRDECHAGDILAETSDIATGTVFVAGNFNNANPNVPYFPKVTDATDNVDYVIEWEAGRGRLEPGYDNRVTGTVGADGDDCHIIRVWDVRLEEGKTYGFIFEQAGEGANVRLCLFDEGRHWVSSDSHDYLFMTNAALATNPPEDKFYEEYTVPAGGTGDYGLVVYNSYPEGTSESYSLWYKEWPKGACCVEGSCEFLTPHRCEVWAGGTYVGDNIPCGPGYGPCSDPIVIGGLCLASDAREYDGLGSVTLQGDLRISGFYEGNVSLDDHSIDLGVGSAAVVDYVEQDVSLTDDDQVMKLCHGEIPIRIDNIEEISANPSILSPFDASIAWTGDFSCGQFDDNPPLDSGIRGDMTFKPNFPVLTVDESEIFGFEPFIPEDVIVGFTGEVNLSDDCTRYVGKIRAAYDVELPLGDDMVFPINNEILVDFNLDITNRTIMLFYGASFLEIGGSGGTYSLGPPAVPVVGGIELYADSDDGFPVGGVNVVEKLEVGLFSGGGDAAAPPAGGLALLRDGDREGVPIGIGVEIAGREQFVDENCNGVWDEGEDFTDNDADDEWDRGSYLYYDSEGLYLEALGTMDIALLFYMHVKAGRARITMEIQEDEGLLEYWVSEELRMGPEGEEWFKICNPSEDPYFRIYYGETAGISLGGSLASFLLGGCSTYIEAEASWRDVDGDEIYEFDTFHGRFTSSLAILDLWEFDLGNQEFWWEEYDGPNGTEYGLRYEADLHIDIPGPDIDVATSVLWGKSTISGTTTQSFVFHWGVIDWDVDAGSTITITNDYCIYVEFQLSLNGIEYGPPLPLHWCLDEPLPRTNGAVSFVATGPADLHFYDGEGRHVGPNIHTGGIDTEIPGANYVDTPASAGKFIGLRDRDLPGESRLLLRGNGSGSCSLFVRYPLHNAEYVRAANYVSIGELGETGVAELTLSDSESFTLRVDDDGDGSWDRYVEPSGQEELILDTSLIQIYGVDVQAVDSQTAEIEWTTNVPATSCVRYGLPEGVCDTLCVSGQLTRNHTVVLEDLEADTRYEFVVASRDSMGRNISFTKMEFRLDELLTGAEEEISSDPTFIPDFRVLPNPSSGLIEIAFHLTSATALELRIFDITGRTVWSKDRMTYEAGDHLVTVDEAVAGDRPLPSGSYFTVARGDGWELTRRTVLVR